MTATTATTAQPLPLTNGVVTLGALCDRYKLDPIRARAKLRKSGLRPRTGCWTWTRDDEDLNLVVKELLRR
jgi:hypothetical protein